MFLHLFTMKEPTVTLFYVDIELIENILLEYLCILIIRKKIVLYFKFRMFPRKLRDAGPFLPSWL